jgi:hypothetical protein
MGTAAGDGRAATASRNYTVLRLSLDLLAICWLMLAKQSIAGSSGFLPG